ncbi:hypothetical protein QGN06_25500 [Achromobacter xylosoxidans]|uniref:hypothetical protein n=1 Tax=Alcaligenes xylosoxydans xylosoxydans TaxID=85698 RepID=UPI003F5F7437
MRRVLVACHAYRVEGSGKIKIQALAGQGFDGWLLDCSKEIVDTVSDGQYLIVEAIPARKKTGRRYLHSHPWQPWRRVSAAEAEEFLRKLSAAERETSEVAY